MARRLSASLGRKNFRIRVACVLAVVLAIQWTTARSGVAATTSPALARTALARTAPAASPRDARYVNGASTDASGIDLCPTSDAPTAQQWQLTRFDTGSSIERYAFKSAAPSTPGQNIALRLQTSSPLHVELYGPRGLVATATGTTIALSYSEPAAWAGTYVVAIRGPFAASGSDCGFRRDVRTFVSTWTGTLAYPAPTGSGETAPSDFPQSCRRVTPRSRDYSC